MTNIDPSKLVVDLDPKATDVVQPKRRRRRGPGGKRARARQIRKLESLLTTVLGCGIPALSLGLSRVAGSMIAEGNRELAMAAGGLVLCVLMVSLSHVAESIQNITGAKAGLAWLMAVAIDASLVLSEVISVTTGASALTCLVIIGGVATVSAALNVHAFKLSQQARR